MGFLRLGVACAARDDDGRILLSKRGDLNVWNLPSGRLDSGELLADAAIREVREETGIEAEIKRIVGLYYYSGWQRMNVLYEAKAIGGSLHQETFETRENRFFAKDALPDDNIDRLMVQDVLRSTHSLMRIISLPDNELRRLKLKLSWRWVKNFLRGHIEPRHTHFNIYGCVGNCEDYKLEIHGDLPLWAQLKLTDSHKLVDIEQNTMTNTLHFIFDVTSENEITNSQK